MKYRTTLTLVTALAVSTLVGLVVLAGTPAHEINAQLPGKNVIAKYSQEIGKNLNLCKDNPFSSHDIPAIVIPSNTSGKNGGITAYGNANSENGKNGPISIGGGYNDKSSSVISHNGDLGGGGGNGGIAFCGSANGQNVTRGGP